MSYSDNKIYMTDKEQQQYRRDLDAFNDLQTDAKKPTRLKKQLKLAHLPEKPSKHTASGKKAVKNAVGN